MELRAYWSIILRRLWVIALIVIIVSLYSGYQYYKIHKTPGALHVYTSNVTLLVGLRSPTKITTNYSDYVSVSDSLAEEFASGPAINSSKFAQQVYTQITTDMPQIEQKFGANPDLGNLTNSSAIRGTISGTRIHDLVTLNVTWSTPAGAWAIMHAVGEVVVEHINEYIDYVVPANPNSAQVITPSRPVAAAEVILDASDPAAVAGSQANKTTLLLLLIFVGLLIGIALAFLIEYLDDRIRKTDDVVQLLQLPIYGEVPQAPSPGSVQRGKRQGTQAVA